MEHLFSRIVGVCFSCAYGPRRRTAARPLALRPLHNAGHTHHERLRHRTAGMTRFNRRNHPFAKVQRIRSRHPCWPPIPASILNQTRTPLGIPNRFSKKRSRSRRSPRIARPARSATATEAATGPRRSVRGETRNRSGPLPRHSLRCSRARAWPSSVVCVREEGL